MNISKYLAGDSKIVIVKYHKNQFRIDWEISLKHAIQINVAASLMSHHTNSCEHIIKKLNGERVTMFFKNVAIYSRLGFK